MLRKLLFILIVSFLSIGLTLGMAIEETYSAILYVSEDGSGDYQDIQEAVDAANPADTIIVSKGSYTGAVIDKPVKIIGSEPGVRVVNYGHYITRQNDEVKLFIVIMRGFTILSSGSETLIRNLEIDRNWSVPPVIVPEGYELRVISSSVYSGGADNVTLTHLKIYGEGNPLYEAYGIYIEDCHGWTVTNNQIEGYAEAFNYGILNFRSEGGEISHNKFELMRGTGGIAIFLRHSSGYQLIYNKIDGLSGSQGFGIALDVWNPEFDIQSNNNLIAFNKINHESEDTGFPGYFGIFLQAEVEGTSVKGNMISQNKVLISSPNVLYAPAIMLLDYAAKGGGIPVVTDNLIELNDFRGSTIDVPLFDPEWLEDLNTISRNLGHDRRSDAAPDFEPEDFLTNFTEQMEQ